MCVNKTSHQEQHRCSIKQSPLHSTGVFNYHRYYWDTLMRVFTVTRVFHQSALTRAMGASRYTTRFITMTHVCYKNTIWLAVYDYTSQSLIQLPNKWMWWKYVIWLNFKIHIRLQLTPPTTSCLHHRKLREEHRASAPRTLVAAAHPIDCSNS